MISLISFGLVSLAPGDFFTRYLLLGGDPEIIEAQRAQLGIDKPWIVQYWNWLKGVILYGDFGVSFQGKGAAADVLFGQGAKIQWTLIIIFSSVVAAWLVGIPVGLFAAIHRGDWIDKGITCLVYAGLSFPNYVVGWIFLLFVYKVINPLLYGPGTWGLLDLHYLQAPMSWAKLGNYLWHLWPAWLIIGFPVFAMVVRYLRMGLIETLAQPYILVSRAKGISEKSVLYKHALRNALNPLVTILGVTFPLVITGSILASQVLGLPTFDDVYIFAIKLQDQHVMTAGILFYSLFILFGNLLADLLLAAIDPRIRYG